MQQLRVTREIDITGAARIGFGAIGQLSGNTYFVNGNSGDDGYLKSSQNWNYPMKTIAATLDICTADHNDYIIVLDHYQETFPIEVDVGGVHIIAAGPWNIGLPMVYLTASGDTTIFDISVSGIEIAGFEFKAGASHAAIEYSTNAVGYGRIRDNCFGRMQTGQDGIKIPSGYGIPQMIIEDNIFGPGLTRDGIRIEQNSTRSIIRNNLFLLVTGIGINVTGGLNNATIMGNRFNLPSDTAGKAITLSASANDNYIVDNKANYGDADSMGGIPWVDASTTDNNTWDNNLTAGVVDYPA